MGDLNSSDCSWKKMVIAKANNEWRSTIKIEPCDEDTIESSINNQENEQASFMVRNNDGAKGRFEDGDADCIVQMDPLGIFTNTDTKPKHRAERSGSSQSERRSMETAEGRAMRLAKMSAYSARRLANESPEQRALRLQRMSEYAARRIAQETHEQRARRLARMSAYAAKRLANETPEQRQIRLAKMSAYSARRQAMKRATIAAAAGVCPPKDTEFHDMTQFS